MARFTRERMISNLMATNPMFHPFDDDAKKQLLARFTGHEVPKGTIFLEQNNPGSGLYVILQGAAEVLKWDDKEYVKLADIGPGDVVGEISLLHEEPITATVRTTAQSTLLFLARELFWGHVRRSAAPTGRVADVVFALGHGMGKAKVGELDCAVVPDEHIAGLDVAVDHPPAVCMGQGSQQIQECAAKLGPSHGAAPDSQRAPFDKLHREVRGARHQLAS